MTQGVPMIAMKDPRNDDKNLWVGWDEYHRLIELLALAVHESGWKFDKILCLARGGLRVGDQLSRIYDLPLAILATSSYREAAGTEQGELDIAQYITMTRGELSGNVLLVDDLVDSGVTLARVQQHLKERYPAITAVRSAVLWYKGCSKVKPDYHVQFLPTNPWIHQPFEEWDTVRPHNLGAWIKRGTAQDRSGYVMRAGTFRVSQSNPSRRGPLGLRFFSCAGSLMREMQACMNGAVTAVWRSLWQGT